MHFSSRTALGAVLLSLACVPAVHAGTLVEDGQLWTSVQVTKALGERFSYTGMAVYRRNNDLRDSALAGAIPALIGYRLDDRNTVALGYAYLDIPGRRPLHEHRALAQFAHMHGRWAGGRWDSTLTLEDRTVNESSDDVLRARWRLRYRAPLAWQIDGRSVGVAASVEPRHYFGNTDWGVRKGYDATRTYVGLELPVSAQYRVDVGYMHHYAPRPGADTMNHALVVALQIVL